MGRGGGGNIVGGGGGVDWNSRHHETLWRCVLLMPECVT